MGKGRKEVEWYEVRLAGTVQPQGEVKIVVEMVLINTVVPFPKEITQVCASSASSEEDDFWFPRLAEREAAGAVFRKCLCSLSLRHQDSEHYRRPGNLHN